MKKYSVLLFVLFSLHFYARAQEIDSTYEVRTLEELTTQGIATGIHLNKYPMLELGYYKHTIFEFPMTLGNAYTVEASFVDNFVIAPKANYWMNVYFINAGISVPFYMDFKGNTSLKLRPEIGIGYNNFKLNYSINLSVTNKDMESVGKHFISLNYYIRLREK